MSKRRDFSPALGDDTSVSLDDILAHLKLWHEDTGETITSLLECRRQVEEQCRHFESPQGALDYIDYFIDFLGCAAADLDGVMAGLSRGLQPAHLDTLRQIASNAALEQRRCLTFRDRWINKPLPYEQARALLTRISNETKDQLVDYRDLGQAAARLAALAGPLDPTPGEPPQGRPLGRRAMFTRWFGT